MPSKYERDIYKSFNKLSTKEKIETILGTKDTNEARYLRSLLAVEEDRQLAGMFDDQWKLVMIANKLAIDCPKGKSLTQKIMRLVLRCWEAEIGKKLSDEIKLINLYCDELEEVHESVRNDWDQLEELLENTKPLNKFEEIEELVASEAKIILDDDFIECLLQFSRVSDEEKFICLLNGLKAKEIISNDNRKEKIMSQILRLFEGFMFDGAISDAQESTDDN